MIWKAKNKRYMAADEQPVQPQPSPQTIDISSLLNMGDDDGMSGGVAVTENKILFYSVITTGSCLELNKILLELDTKLSTLRNVFPDFTPVIQLRINTYGGEVHAALSTVDIIRSLRCDVHTYIDGAVASAGTLISAVGKKRFMGAHAHFLIHQLSGDMYGKFSEMEDEIYNAQNLMKLLKDYYKKNTKIPMKKLDELLKRDIFLSAQECLEYGIIDEII